MNDNRILEFQQGNKQSYRLLFNSLYSGMCLFAKRFVLHYDDAEDITQEVFIELWNQRAKFTSIDQVKAFLYLAIKNRCINFQKHLIVREKHVVEITAQQDDLFEDFVLEAEVINNLNVAINALPGQRRRIIQLSMQGMSNPEIAEELQISVNTVKLQKKIAYKQLREKLKSSVIAALNLLFLVS